MDGVFFVSIDRTDDAIISYSGRVNSLIRSETASFFGESPLPSFASRVDRAIRSRTPSSMSNFDETSLLFSAPQLFTLSELQAATNNFSLDNKIGAGSMSVVYRGKLIDGREVAIKRGGAWSKINSLFLKSELGFLSSVPHNQYLVGVVGLCQEKNERLLVYEYMHNGSLYDNLHHKYSNVLNSWKMRIRIALDASCGMQYLVDYAIPYVERVIKSSNILLDANWRVRVSDYRMMFTKLGYNDPEYGSVYELRKKRDVYAFGLLLLELLTGSIGKYGSSGIHSEEVHGFTNFLMSNKLDPRVEPPELNEARAVRLVADTATRCVVSDVTVRPTMAQITSELRQAFRFCY
ncbi:hypothetical protein Fmac_014587 [Flemingia macrophylla]|uniref:Protein kinase domain-containing protein n=1 Tax=Flemingia macrophylla TaxID=520843 RepID=A0ABD1MC74_9FABA